jgi:hypothetical protein
VPRKPIIFWSLPTVKPGRPLSTMNMLISLSPVLAETRKKSLHSPSLMKCLLPLSTQPVSVFVARVLMPAASEPAPGSVMAMAQVRCTRTAGSASATCAPGSPAAARTRCQRPADQIVAGVAELLLAEDAVQRGLRPPPPQLLGACSRQTDPVPWIFQKWPTTFRFARNPWFSSSSSSGCSSSAMKRRMVSIIIFCSSLKEKSKGESKP